MSALLDLRGVTRVYDDGHEVMALRETDLVVRAGDHITITGPSGAGKSTLLNVLGLLDKPSRGQYLIQGVDSGAMTEAVRGAVRGQLFGFVFQAFHLLAGRTAVENVGLGMLYGPHSPKERGNRAAEALDRVRMSHRADADPRTLSGGEKQRVAIARAIAGEPAVLFCDEPTGNLDSVNTENLLELLHELHRDGLTLIIVTHDREVAARGDRILTVRDGSVTEAAG